MKTFRTTLLFLILSLLLWGCGGEAPAQDTSETAASATTEMPQAETEPEVLPCWVGNYRRTVSGEEEQITEHLQIYGAGEMLLLEHTLLYGESQELFDTWAEEFWPDQPQKLYDGSRQLTGRSQCYSIMAMGGGYQDLPAEKTLIWEPEGFTVVFPQEGTVHYESTQLPGIHTPAVQLEAMRGDVPLERDLPQILGRWICQDGSLTAYLELCPDGSFHYEAKKPGEPCWVLEGIWGRESGGDLLLLGERLGWGTMPLIQTLRWSMDQGGNLCLQALEEDPVPPFENQVIFLPLEGEYTLDPWGADPLGYAVNVHNVSGSYVDSFGSTWKYSYRTPWVLGHTAAVEELNRRLEDSVILQADQALRAADLRETPGFLHIDWEASVYEDLLFLRVWSEDLASFTDHACYCLDLQQDRLLEPPAVLERLGIGETEFLEAVRQAVEEEYLRSCETLPECIRSSPEYERQLQWTLANVSTDLMTYVDYRGNLAVITPIGSHAGADWYYHILYPRCTPDSST